MQLTVIVNIWQDHVDVSGCLAGFAAQTHDTAQFEIRAILHANAGGARDSITAWARKGMQIIIVDGPKLGDALGGKALAPLVACLDSQAIPTPDWAANVVAAAQANPMAVGFVGHTQPQWVDGQRPDWMTDWMMRAYGCTEVDAKQPWPLAGNTAYRREALGVPALTQLEAADLTGPDVIYAVLADQGGDFIDVPGMQAERGISAVECDPNWLSKNLFAQGRIAAKQAQFLAQHIGQRPPWADVRPPAGMKDWEAMVNLQTDSTLEETLIKTYDLGVLLAQVGLLDCGYAPRC